MVLIEVACLTLCHSGGGTEIQWRFAAFKPSVLANTLHRLSSKLDASVCVCAHACVHSAPRVEVTHAVAAFLVHV